MTVICLFLLLFVFMFLGVPIAISLGLSGAVSILLFSPDSLSSLAIKLFETSDSSNPSDTACTIDGKLGRGSSSHICDFMAKACERSCMMLEPSP